jgi:hypothetical protein
VLAVLSRHQPLEGLLKLTRIINAIVEPGGVRRVSEEVEKYGFVT